MSVGEGHACGIRRSDGHVVCWGGDYYGQVSGAPPSTAFDAVAAGYDHTCGIRRSDGQTVCWGRDDDGQVSGAP